MKLAVIMPPILPMPSLHGGGVERLTDIFLRLNETADEPVSITVISRHDDRAEALSKDFRHTKFLYVNTTKSEPLSNRLKSNISMKLGGQAMRFDYLAGVKKALKEVDFDTILLEDCYEFARPLEKAFGIKPILHAHSCFFGKDFPGWRRGIASLGCCLFVSEYLRNYAQRCGFPNKLSRVVYNCVDTSLFDASKYSDIRREKREKYGISDDDILVVYEGRLIPEKGVVELCKAVGQCEYSAASIKLLIVGSADYGVEIHDEYREQLEAAAPSGRVIFIGGVKSASAARFLARADIAVVPSVWDEPAGLPVLEALSTGLPLIVSDSGGICEYVGECSSVTTVKRGLGYVTSLAAAIDKIAAKLHTEPGYRQSAAAESRSRAVKFDSSGYYRRLLDALTDK